LFISPKQNSGKGRTQLISRPDSDLFFVDGYKPDSVTVQFFI